MGVYGTFLDSFQELIKTYEVKERGAKTWTKARAIFIPKGGNNIVRRKFTSGVWAGDIATEDYLFVGRKYLPLIKEGTYIKIKNDTYTVMSKFDYDDTGSFTVFILERQQGATDEQNAELKIKRGTFS